MKFGLRELKETIVLALPPLRILFHLRIQLSTMLSHLFCPSRVDNLSGRDVASYLRECSGSKLLAMTNGSHPSVISTEHKVCIL